MTTCLDDDDVARFVVEPVGATWRAARAPHVSDCDACRVRVALAMIDLVHEDEVETSDAPPPRRDGGFRWSEGDLVGRYRLLEELGRGGMGVVFAARELASGTERALKFLFLPDPKGARRLLREARAMHIEHPGIVPVAEVLHDVDVAPVLVMERLRGATLAHRLTAGGRPTLPEAGRIVARVLEALDAIHRVRAVHRDMKPANVFLEDSGAVRLLDFGLVWLDPAEDPEQTQLTTTAAIVGTPRYLAPEVALGARATSRADLWGAGHIAFEALTGERAIRARQPGATLRAIVTSEPMPRADDRDARLPRRVADLVAALLAKEPAERPPSASAALTAWRDALASAGIAI